MIFQTLILRGIIFFGCVAFFSNLFRGEVLDRSLHYYLLSPLKRPVLVIAKFLSGLTITWVLFMGTTAISYLLIYPPFGLSRGIEDLFNGPGGGQLLAYAGIAMLACIGYGSVFMILGLWFKNPVVPAVSVFGWEAIHFLLPPMLKRISVIHYLKGMIPIPMSEGPFAVVTDPPPVLPLDHRLARFFGRRADHRRPRHLPLRDQVRGGLIRRGAQILSARSDGAMAPPD